MTKLLAATSYMSDTRESSQSTSITESVPHGRLAALEKITPEVFIPFVEDVFQVVHQPFETEQTHINPLNVGPEPATEVIVELKLVEVTRYPKIEEREDGFDARPREPFSLLFEGPLDPALISAVHQVQHDQLGKGRLFLSNVQATLKQSVDGQPDARYYETVFS